MAGKKSKPIKDLTDEELMNEIKKAVGTDEIEKIVKEIPDVKPEKDNDGD